MSAFEGNERGSIRVIPTTYNGTAFRSATEARFAEWCDTNHLEWFYEPEGFEMNGLRYLPDFYIPSGLWIIEIKPPMFMHECYKIDAMRKSVPGFHYAIGSMKGRSFQWSAHNDWNGLGEGKEQSGWVHPSDVGWQDSSMWYCERCTRPYFPTDQSFDCPHCGHYPGGGGGLRDKPPFNGYVLTDWRIFRSTTPPDEEGF